MLLHQLYFWWKKKRKEQAYSSFPPTNTFPFMPELQQIPISRDSSIERAYILKNYIRKTICPAKKKE